MVLLGYRTPLSDQPFAHRVFEAHAERYPERLALTCGEVRCSYRELNDWANQLAHHLMGRGIGAGSVVGVCLDRSLEMAVTILAILKSGAAYAPLDPTYPPGRLRLMMSQLSSMELIAAAPSTLEMVSESGTEILDVVAARPRLTSLPVANPAAEITGDNICYVVFTSGSTGAPKAVAVRHKGWHNLLSWLVRDFDLGTDSSGLLLSPFGFDISQRGFMAPLFTGSVLHLLPSRNFDAFIACRLMRDLEVRTLHCAPSAFYLLVERSEAEAIESFGTFDFAFLGGEPIAASRLEDWATKTENSSKLVNVYGVAECSDVSTSHVLMDYADYVVGGVPIGRPIDNVSIHVLAEDLTATPSGEVGEICISGVGIGAGYLNDDQMNADRFVTVGLGNSPVSIYRTGDLGRVRQDGELMYVGRADKQVKIRGMRVDLGDVEAALEGSQRIQQAIVVPVHGDEAHDTQLLAFILLSAEDPGVAFDALAVRRELFKILPVHMVPSRIRTVTQFPLSPNGKVDRDALALIAEESVWASADDAGVVGVR